MKLLRVGKKGNEKPAIIDNEGKIRDLSFIIKDFNPDSLNHSTIDSIKETPNQILNQTQVEQLKQNVEDFEQEGNDLNTYKGAPALKSRITEYEVAKENLESSFGEDTIPARKMFQEKEESLRTLLVNGEVNSFGDRIIELDNEVTTLEGSKTLVDGIADLQTEIEE